MADNKAQVPICDKVLLTLEEATELFNIGRKKLIDMTDDGKCNFVLFNGNKRLIKREALCRYLEHLYSI